jgi:hypothetical protein
VRRNTTRRRLTAGIVVTVTTTLAGCSLPFTGSRARAETAQTVTLDGTSALTVDNSLGAVDIGVGGVDDIEVEQSKTVESGESDLSKLELQTERDGEETHLQTNWTGVDQGVVSDPSVDLTVTVPESLRVSEVTTEGGSVSITEAAGAVSVETAGSITVDDTEAVSDLISAAGAVDADVNGLDGETTFRSVDQSVTARLADDLDAVVEVNTESGSVEFEGELANDSPDSGAPRVIVGDGGPTLTLSATSGDVTVTRQR